MSKRKIMLLQTRHIESISYLSAELLSAFPSDAYDVTLVYLEHGSPSNSDVSAHDCIFLNLKKEDYKGLRLKAIKKLKEFLKNNQFDVIIANMYKPINLLMQLRHVNNASLCIGIIHTFGEFDRLGRRLMMRWMLEPRWRIVGVSESVSDYLIRANCGLNSSNTLTINNAIDVDAVSAKALSRVNAKEALNLPGDGTVFGTVGRCVQGKRHLELVKAFHQFIKQDQNAYLVVIGDGDLYCEVNAYVDAHQLHDKVFLVGYLPEAVKYLRALDVFVLPSESEGFSIALLEAMSLSLPIIINRISSLTTVINDDQAEADSSNINDLARTIQAFYVMSKEELRNKGSQNFSRANNLYNIKIYREAYRGLVESYFGGCS